MSFLFLARQVLAPLNTTKLDLCCWAHSQHFPPLTQSERSQLLLLFTHRVLFGLSNCWVETNSSAPSRQEMAKHIHDTRRVYVNTEHLQSVRRCHLNLKGQDSFYSASCYLSTSNIFNLSSKAELVWKNARLEIQTTGKDQIQIHFHDLNFFTKPFHDAELFLNVPRIFPDLLCGSSWK